MLGVAAGSFHGGPDVAPQRPPTPCARSDGRGAYLDLSLALPFLGAGAGSPLIEALALAPASTLMYGSDVRALPELFALAAEWARAALAEVLGWLATRERRSDEEAWAIAARILTENARILSRLPRTA